MARAEFGDPKYTGITDDGDRPDVIVPVSRFEADRNERNCEREHEAARKAVGKLPVGTRISFWRPGELQRSGVIAAVPAEFCYRVRTDDGRFDRHLDTGLVAVLWASHHVVVLDKQGDKQETAMQTANERMEEPAEAGTTDGEERIIERRRELVEKVNRKIETGVPVADACVQVSRETGEALTGTMYYRWRKVHDLPLPAQRSFEAGAPKHERRTGPALGADHWRAFLRRVAELVDGPERMGVTEAVALANGEMGCRHTNGSYYQAVRRYDIRPAVSKSELISRSRAGKGATGEPKEPPKDSGGGEIAAEVAAEAEAHPDHIDLLCQNLTTLTVALGEELVAVAADMQARIVGDAARLVGDLRRAQELLAANGRGSQA